MTAVDAARRRVVMTGACGSIGRAVSPTLARRWNLRLTDVAPDCDARLDVVDFDACRSAFSGADAIIHLAAVPDPDASWDALRDPNVTGAYNVCRAAAECGVRRLVLASSLHAVYLGSRTVGSAASAIHRVPPISTARPRRGARRSGHGRPPALGLTRTSVVALRIGYFAASSPVGTGVGPRDLGAWLSHRDCAELIRAAVEAEHISFTVANGISANRHPTADLAETRRSLGYAPVDDAWASG